MVRKTRRSGIQMLADWIKTEPCHRSIKIHIGDEGQMVLQACDDFDGHRVIEAEDLVIAVRKLTRG